MSLTHLLTLAAATSRPSTHDALVIFALASVIFCSMSFLGMAIVINRQWSKAQRDADNKLSEPRLPVRRQI